MGQYYLPVVKNSEGEFKTFYAHQYDHNGLKLMEHSWNGNNFVAAVLNELLENPCSLYWLGDYAQDEDFKNSDSILTKDQRDKLEVDETLYVTPTEENQIWAYSKFFIINLTKKEYIQLNKLIDDWDVCPVPILTSVGNGRGLGDYRGVNEDKAGIWAGDTILVSKTCEYPDFINKTEEYYFEKC